MSCLIHFIFRTLDDLVVFSGELAEQFRLPDMIGLVKIKKEHSLTNGRLAIIACGNFASKRGFVGAR